MLLSVNFTIVFAFFSVAVNFNPSLCCLSPFLLSYVLYVAISRPYVTCRNFTLLNKPYPKQPNPIKQAILYCIVLYHNNLYFPENNHGT